MGGRVILEEDRSLELLILSHPGIVLVPGQTMPLTIFRPNQASAMKRLLETTKTFGSLHVTYQPGRAPGYVESVVGTTAEIYEYRDPPEDSLEVGLKLKVRGRQRFRVLSKRTQVDG